MKNEVTITRKKWIFLFTCFTLYFYAEKIYSNKHMDLLLIPDSNYIMEGNESDKFIYNVQFIVELPTT